MASPFSDVETAPASTEVHDLRQLVGHVFMGPPPSAGSFAYNEARDDGRTTFLDEAIRIASGVSPTVPFSTFRPRHAEVAGKLFGYFLALEQEQDKTVKDILNMVNAMRTSRTTVNSALLQYATSVFLAHSKNPNAKRAIPNPVALTPERFIKFESNPSAVLSTQPQSPLPVGNFQTYSDREPESRVAWWREDPWLNSHHWHWHIVYPSHGLDANNRPIYKDRQGELFYYMHQQMLARYDVERHCAQLRFVVALEDWDGELEGYDPHLTAPYGAVQFGARPPKMKMPRSVFDGADSDSPDQGNRMPLVTMQNWRDRIMSAVDMGHFTYFDKAKQAMTTEKVTIDKLMATVEPNNGSVSPEYYGQLHNFGHDFISQASDPERLLRSAPGAIGFLDTAIRDPVFFRWHRFIDNIAVRFLETLPPHDFAPQNLVTSKIQVEFMTAPPTDSRCNDEGFIAPPSSSIGLAFTKMTPTPFDVAKVFDTVNHGDILTPDAYVPAQRVVNVWRLSRTPFDLRFTVQAARDCNVTVRVFLRIDADNKDDLLNRRLFVEMDRFMQHLTAGRNEFLRRDVDSSVILPDSGKLDDIFDPLDPKIKPRDEAYCRCGLPTHLLLPKGTQAGTKFKLFVMLTDWAADATTDNGVPCCSSEYCGLRNKLYPDKRPMGYPFDRPWRPEGREASFAETFRRVLGENVEMAETSLTVVHLPRDTVQPIPSVLNPFQGRWIYRSYQNLSELLDTSEPAERAISWERLVFGEGKLELHPAPYSEPSSKLIGSFDFGPNYVCDVHAYVDLSQSPPAITMKAVGRPGTPTQDWEYVYSAYLILPYVEAQRGRANVVLGTVMRAKAHGSAPAFQTASFQMVPINEPLVAGGQAEKE